MEGNDDAFRYLLERLISLVEVARVNQCIPVAKSCRTAEGVADVFKDCNLNRGKCRLTRALEDNIDNRLALELLHVLKERRIDFGTIRLDRLFSWLRSVGRLFSRLLSVDRLFSRLRSVDRLFSRLLSVDRLFSRLLSVDRLLLFYYRLIRVNDFDFGIVSGLFSRLRSLGRRFL